MSSYPSVLLVPGRQQLCFTLLPTPSNLCLPCTRLVSPFMPGIHTSLDCFLHYLFILKIDKVFSPIPFVLRNPGFLFKILYIKYQCFTLIYCK